MKNNVPFRGESFYLDHDLITDIQNASQFCYGFKEKICLKIMEEHGINYSLAYAILLGNRKTGLGTLPITVKKTIVEILKNNREVSDSIIQKYQSLC